MKVLKKASQKNVYVSADYLTQNDIDILVRDGILWQTEAGYLLPTEYVTEIKVINEAGSYYVVAVMDSDKLRPINGYVANYFNQIILASL